MSPPNHFLASLSLALDALQAWAFSRRHGASSPSCSVLEGWSADDQVNEQCSHCSSPAAPPVPFFSLPCLGLRQVIGARSRTPFASFAQPAGPSSWHRGGELPCRALLRRLIYWHR